MNKQLKIGLILQIPNVLALICIILIFGLPMINFDSFTYKNTVLIIGGTVYALLNIFSIILIIAGLGNNNVNQKELTNKYLYESNSNYY